MKRQTKAGKTGNPPPDVLPPATPEPWRAAWPAALAVWSRFTRLRDPTLCVGTYQAKATGLVGGFAGIRLVDQTIVIDLQTADGLGLAGYELEILAHEVGHHILAPATPTDLARCIARMRRALPGVEDSAPEAANLYTDILVNDRLRRSAGLRIDEVYVRLLPVSGGTRLWTLYMRIYELLWGLRKGSLGGEACDDPMEGDATLGARLVRSFAADWLDGAGRFAALLFPYFLERGGDARPSVWSDTGGAGSGADPSGLTSVDPGEIEGAIHPALDPDLMGRVPAQDGAGADGPSSAPVEKPAARPAGQAREPFEYGQILRASGLPVDDHEAAIRYYRERALPHLVPFPSTRMPEGSDPLPEGLETWETGDPLDELDWFQTMLQSPRPIPGATTVKRTWGTTEGAMPRVTPFDLDLFVDSSGSMADPRVNVSYPALAGAIVCLSALRAGARVRVTLWSGAHQFDITDGFVRDEHAALSVLTGYFGGGTAFPLHVLRDRYLGPKPPDRPAHIMVISDDGVSTMFGRDERKRAGWDIAEESLARAGGGGTWVLNIPEDWESAGQDRRDLWIIRRARDEMGWAVHRVAAWDELVAFARAFARVRYGSEAARGMADAGTAASGSGPW